MGENPIEGAKGRIKEAAGSLSGSDSLKREGEGQREKAEAQEDAARAKDRAESAESKERANQ